MIGASFMDWSTDDRWFGNTFIEMDLHCECPGECPDPNSLPDTEIGWNISFGIEKIIITEVRTRFVETRPYRTHLERSRVVAQAKVENWDVIRHKISNFLQLPVGFE